MRVEPGNRGRHRPQPQLLFHPSRVSEAAAIGDALADAGRHSVALGESEGEGGC